MPEDNSDDTQTLSNVLAAIISTRNDGSPIVYDPTYDEQTARIAIRRWRSSPQRGIDPADKPARIRDLVKGLVHRLEPNPKLVGPLIRDYEYLATQIANAMG